MSADIGASVRGSIENNGIELLRSSALHFVGDGVRRPLELHDYGQTDHPDYCDQYCNHDY